jgi:preprotein translocase subunit Sss1
MERRQVYLDIAILAAIGVLLAAGLLGYLAALLGGLLVSLAFIHDEL